MRHGSILPLSLLLLSGCPNPDTRHFTKKKPKNEDLVGTYVPDAKTLRWIRQAGKYPEVENSVVLSADGSFQMINMPDCWTDPFGIPKGRFDSGIGEWQSVRLQEWWDLRLTFRSRKEFASDPHDSGWVTFVPVVGQTPPYRLWLYVGDPDGGQRMIFEKKPESPAR